MLSARKMVKHGLATLWPSTILIKGKPTATSVALTFDDGPHPKNTCRILDILNRDSATATFFLQGREAEKYPELVREIFAYGYQIGNHGYAHLDAKRTPLQEYIKDINRAQDALQNIIGTKLEKILRPPFGSITGMAFFFLALSGYRLVFWSIDSGDSIIRSSAELIAHIETIPINGGDILLFHEDYSHTIIALPAILQTIRERGLAFSQVANIE